MIAAQYLGDSKFGIADSVPVAPKAGEVRLDVGYVGICGTDMHIYHGAMDKRVAPKETTGHEASGIVREVGEGVTDVKVGDRVVVRPLDYCGDCPACDAGHSHICHNLKFMGVDSVGAFQSSWTVKARTIHKLPDTIDLRQGALIEPLAVACHDISMARVKAGEHVVVLGGGPIGQLVAAVAKAEGADVVISEINADRRAFAEANGIKAVDPLNQDLVGYVNAWTGTKGADVVFEVSGVQPAVDVMTEIAAVRGRICIVAIYPATAPPKVNLFKFFWRELELVGARVYEAADFEKAIDLVSSGKVDIDKFITSEFDLTSIDEAFHTLATSPVGMKTVVKCGA
ncbi:zinc-dependent alcohol dehydrogenase [Hirschia litorea]|uniref:Zinc-binding dehydrogenase n=1 Tax=Hirschia litorea TaxID=1199156 RepID=A0ABW2IPF3_9PROT